MPTFIDTFGSLEKRPRVEERFLAKVDKITDPNGCWLWKGSKRRGYGNLYASPPATPICAHRAAFLLYIGPITQGMLVCHKCDKRDCVNPDHLFLGTPQENSLDMVKKGRHKPRKDHGTNGKLTIEEVKFLRTTKRDTKNLAERFGVSETCIRQIRRGQTWKTI